MTRQTTRTNGRDRTNGGERTGGRVLLLLRSDENRRLLARALGADHEVVVSEDLPRDESFDLCLLDEEALSRNADALGERREAERPLFLPAMLLSSAATDEDVPDPVWEVVDDVVTRPISRGLLRRRVAALLRTRELSIQRTRSERWFDSVISTASDAVVIVDAEAVIQFANQAVHRLLGYDASALVGQSVTVLIPDHLGERAAAAIEAYLGSAPDDASKSLETVASHRLGHEVPVRLSYSTFSYAGDRYITGIVHDISAAKRREQRLRVLNRVLRHDIRNDINVVIGHADLVLAGTEDPTESAELIKENAHDIVKLAERARKLESLIGTDQIDRSCHDVAEVLRRQTDRHARERPDAVIELDAPDAACAAGIDLLGSAFDNLLENAFEHNESEAPRVDVVVEPPPDEGGTVTVRISDNGPGIPPRELDLLATGAEDPIDHTSGLGLWLVTWIVSESGGSVRFEANEPRGTTAVVRLEAATPSDDGPEDRCW
jgi:PAS domain S-box-containing protein